jgi:hypothetical protein
MEKSEMITELMKDCLFIQKEKEISKAKGDFFNVFKILGLSTNEVRTHSAFISELLDPIGIHGQGKKFLDEFLKIVELEKLTINEATVTKEKYISIINDDYTQGGNIDILIEFFTGNVRSYIIKIENKIYAADQRNQLLRYYNYDEETPQSLFYLTIFGRDPDIISSQKLIKDIHYKTLSYENNILKWLEACIKLIEEKPIIAKSIEQYSQIIKFLINKNHFMAETKNLLKDNLDYLKIVKEINDSFNELIDECCSKIRRQLEFGKLKDFYIPNSDTTIWNSKNNYEHSKYIFKYKFDQDNVGFYYQFFAEEKENKEAIQNDSKKVFSDILRNYGFKNSGVGIGWKFPKKFENKTLEKSEEILEAINSTERFDNLVREIIAEFENDMIIFIGLVNDK